MSGETTLGLKGTIPLILDINDHTFVQHYMIYKKLKQPLIVELDFTQRYKIGADWDAYGTLFLGYKGKMIATAMKKGNPCQQTIAFLGTLIAEKWARDK